MRPVQIFSVFLLCIPAFSAPGKSLDGIWCSRGEKSVIQFEYKETASIILQDQFCILLKTTSTIDDVSVGRAITQYKRVLDYPTQTAGYVVDRKDSTNMLYDAGLFAFAKDDGRNRLIIVDSSDRTTFDLTLKGENLLQGFVQEIGWISKTKVRNAFAGFVRFDRTSDLPDDFDSQWSKYDAASGHIVVKYR